MNWTEVLNQIIQILLPVLATVLTAVGTYVATRIKTLYTNKVNDETTKKVIESTVKFVEQVYKDLDGTEKLKKAIEQASEILQSKGINITDAEINMLIESAVYGMNQASKTKDNEKQKLTESTNTKKSK